MLAVKLDRIDVPSHTRVRNIVQQLRLIHALDTSQLTGCLDVLIGLSLGLKPHLFFCHLLHNTLDFLVTLHFVCNFLLRNVYLVNHTHLTVLFLNIDNCRGNSFISW